MTNLQTLMKMNNTTRKCIATNKVCDVSELIRIVKTKSGKYFVNSNEKGRGAYVSKHFKDIEELKRKRLLNRSFKTQVPTEVYDELEKILKED